MKKLMITAALFVAGTSAVMAQRMLDRAAKATFDATSPSSPEKIVGVNNEVAFVVVSTDGKMQIQMPVNSFKFEKALMKDHFNENYMESEKYPKAEFKGQITNLAEVNFKKDGTYPTKVTGKLTIHGVTNEVTVTGSTTVKGEVVTMNAKFKVELNDYKISVPGVVADKLAKMAVISITGQGSFK